MTPCTCRVERLCIGAILTAWLFALALDAVLRWVQHDYAH